MIRASEYKDVGPVGSKSHDHMLGKGYLCAVVTQDAANWPTPAVMDTTGGSYKTEWKDGRAVSYHNHAQENPVAYGAKLADAVKYGPVDLANPSTNGSRQELSEEAWPTPTAMSRVRDEATMQKCLKFRQSNGKTSVPLYLEEKVNLVEKKSWATPIQGDSHLASTPEVAQKRIEEGKVTLSRQNPGKLNPRWVETLMGLPVGWTMPSCASPVTIELTSCASSAMELCQQQQSEHSELF
jgi:hypothetical protein